jgi:hypothetical protein
LSVVANGIASEWRPVRVQRFRPPVAVDDAFVDFVLTGLGDGQAAVLGPRGGIPVDPAKAELAAKAKQGRDQIVGGVRRLRELGRQVDTERLQEAAAFPSAVDPELKQNSGETMIQFRDVQAYLDAVAQKNGKLADSPHGAFWNTDYTSFTTGQVPNVGIPIMDTTNPAQSPFYLILINPKGYQGIEQMPPDGPYITDPGYQVTLADGTSVTGKQIVDNIADWLSHGFPQ